MIYNIINYIEKEKIQRINLNFEENFILKNVNENLDLCVNQYENSNIELKAFAFCCVSRIFSSILLVLTF